MHEKATHLEKIVNQVLMKISYSQKHVVRVLSIGADKKGYWIFNVFGRKTFLEQYVKYFSPLVIGKINQ